MAIFFRSVNELTVEQVRDLVRGMEGDLRDTFIGKVRDIIFLEEILHNKKSFCLYMNNYYHTNTEKEIFIS